MKISNLMEATTPINVKKNDPGLMTLSEYIEHRNPEGKSHPDTSYDSDLKDLNMVDIHAKLSQSFPPRVVTVRGRNMLVTSNHSNTIYGLYHIDNPNFYPGDTVNELAALWYDNTWYYHPKLIDKESINQLNLNSGSSFKESKYPERVFSEIRLQMVGEINRKEFTDPIKRIKVGNEYLTLCYNKDKDNFPILALLNSDWLKVAYASNEWGTTLIQVAREYRGKGLGPFLASAFIDDQQLPSGGYTPSGEANAVKIWKNRVSDFLKNGWYTELVKQGEITTQRVKEITKDFDSRAPVQDTNPKQSSDGSEDKEQFLLYSDDYISFILYDQRFFEEQDEKYIYGFTFLRDNDTTNDIVYRFDYVNDNHRKILSYVLLQAQKNHGTGINTGFSGSDMFELSGLKHIEEKDGYVYLTKDMVQLDDMLKAEKKIRQKYDEFNELEYMLIEMAESKFD